MATERSRPTSWGAQSRRHEEGPVGVVITVWPVVVGELAGPRKGPMPRQITVYSQPG
jgi:hypothetical protein